MEKISLGWLLIKTKDSTFEVEVIESIGNFMPNDTLRTSIYVMPDDSIEIRSIEKKVIAGKVIGLTGDDVRTDTLHRDEWYLQSN